MRHDILSDVFNVIKIAENVGKRECIVPASRVVRDVLKIMQANGYIGTFEYIDDGKGGKFKVKILGKINEAKAIRPRFNVKKNEFIKWEKRFLPSVNDGILIVSTSSGIMTHRDAKKLNIGGLLLGYVY